MIQENTRAASKVDNTLTCRSKGPHTYNEIIIKLVDSSNFQQIINSISFLIDLLFSKFGAKNASQNCVFILDSNILLTKNKL